MKKLTNLLALSLISMIFLFSSCNPSIYLTVKRPAEINLKDYKKIAIGSITSSSGWSNTESQDVADNLTTKLFDSKTFEVVDRQQISRIIEEQKLGASGLVDENTAAGIGNIIGTAVMVFGRIQTKEYNENISKGSTWTDKDGRSYTTYTRTGVYTFIINLKLIDVKTTKILAVRTIQSVKSQQTTAINNRFPPEIDQLGLYTNAVDGATSQFMKMIAPYNETVVATFERDKDLPELDRALTQQKVGEWDECVKILGQAAARMDLKPTTKAKAHYNYGLVLTYSSKYDEAIAAFKEAMNLDPKKTRYQDGIVLAKSEKAKADKLKEQQ